MKTILIEPGYGHVNTRVWELYNATPSTLVRVLSDRTDTKPLFDGLCRNLNTETTILNHVIRGKVDKIVIESGEDSIECYFIAHALRQKSKSIQTIHFLQHQIVIKQVQF